MTDSTGQDRRAVLKAAAFAVAAAPAVVAHSAPAVASQSEGASMKRGYFDGPDGQIHYWTAGTGPNLFLIHQSNNLGDEYAALIPFLADKYRLITIDLPGHGRSDDPSGPHTVDNLTAAAIALADHLDLKKFHILGHHGGALVAMNAAAKIPDRIDKTIISGSSGPKTPEEAAAFAKSLRTRAAPIDWEGDSIGDTWDRIVAVKSDAAEIEQIMLPYIATIKNRMRPHNVYDAFLTWDRTEALNALKGPVLLIQGDRDIFVSHQERLLAIMPNATRVELKGSGPFMFYDDAENCARVVAEFLG